MPLISWRSLLIAAQFLTSFPIKIAGNISPEDNAKGLLFYPSIGLVIGLILFVFSSLLTPSDLAAALILLVWTCLTGALHLDGLADSADAWIAGHSDSSRTLTVMKDPASGAVAVTTLILVLLLKWAAIKALLFSETYLIIFSPVIARMMVTILIMTTPYVRESGLGADMKKHLPNKQMLYVLLGFSVLLFFMSFKLAFITLFFAAITTFILRYFMLKRIHGFTGDTAGATIEIIELTTLIILAINLN